MADEAADIRTDRRGRQRFVARRNGGACFWAQIEGRREPLNDLSLEGFAITAKPSTDGPFEVILYRAAVPDEIRATARVANFFASADGPQCGCRFEAFEGKGHERLRDWLIAHVIASATLPITEKDAERIVSGPSLI